MTASKQSQDGTDSAWKRSSETCMKLNQCRMYSRINWIISASGWLFKNETEENV
jgi:hypothetical protein